jgi:hypothetical protein
MIEPTLKLEGINSHSQYVVHGPEGLISEHKSATDAVQSLLLRAEDGTFKGACVYRRYAVGSCLLL